MTNPANDDTDFKSELIALIPQMRAFARSLCGNAAEADDLSQEGLAKAWACRSRYTPGTNLKAWAFMILRNQFYSDKRRSWRSTSLDPEVAERTLVATSSVEGTLELEELRRAMAMLSDDQREALILIGAAGFSYEEVAQTCGVAIGTIKSRVSRARDRLALIYAEGVIAEDNRLPSVAMTAILHQIDQRCQARRT